MMTIQRKGNTAIHPQESPTPPSNAAAPALEALSNVTKWYFKQYASQDFKPKDKDKSKIITEGGKIIKNPTVEKVAIGVMAATAGILAGKLFNKKKET